MPGYFIKSVSACNAELVGRCRSNRRGARVRAKACGPLDRLDRRHAKELARYDARLVLATETRLLLTRSDGVLDRVQGYDNRRLRQFLSYPIKPHFPSSHLPPICRQKDPKLIVQFFPQQRLDCRCHSFFFMYETNKY